ncbi:hypothetical protein F2P81_001742 [Scophthalmus maximus]|uniref:MARVEL domain-containing protein n=1 Tax=Scophthalmus maximus TaxID=52904 RepID=A0A6A4TH04_SCOMX|nr:hypothetical protein F2P81_001742 [Scophthalmus maximus]
MCNRQLGSFPNQSWDKGDAGVDGPSGLKGKPGTTCDCGRYRKVVGQLDVNTGKLRNAVKFLKNVILGLKETEERYYLLVKEPKRFREASMNCKLRGGTLAMPKTTNTNRLMADYVSRAGLTRVYIGVQAQSKDTQNYTSAFLLVTGVRCLMVMMCVSVWWIGAAAACLGLLLLTVILSLVAQNGGAIRHGNKPQVCLMECENLVYNLTKDKDALRDERDQLRINASNLTKAIEVLQSQYNTVSASRDKLQEDVRRLNVSREVYLILLNNCSIEKALNVECPMVTWLKCFCLNSRSKRQMSPRGFLVAISGTLACTNTKYVMMSIIFLHDINNVYNNGPFITSGLSVSFTVSPATTCKLFGGLVWILVASSNVPVPLLQGWVMFVSVITFFLSSAYITLLITGLADRINTDWNFLDVVYHFIAVLFYFAAFVLEAATTAANGGAHIKPLPNSTETVMCITYPRGNIFTVLDGRQYSINVAATIFAFVVTLCYGCSMGLLIAVSQYLFDAATMSRQNQYLSTLTHRRFMKVNKTSVHGFLHPCGLTLVSRVVSPSVRAEGEEEECRCLPVNTRDNVTGRTFVEYF